MPAGAPAGLIDRGSVNHEITAVLSDVYSATATGVITRRRSVCDAVVQGGTGTGCEVTGTGKP